VRGGHVVSFFLFLQCLFNAKHTVRATKEMSMGCLPVTPLCHAHPRPTNPHTPKHPQCYSSLTFSDRAVPAHVGVGILLPPVFCESPRPPLPLPLLLVVLAGPEAISSGPIEALSCCAAAREQLWVGGCECGRGGDWWGGVVYWGLVGVSIEEGEREEAII
jgi:hypothetical protein